jgi:tetratricopeptide (TPR) repeat protein
MFRYYLEYYNTALVINPKYENALYNKGIVLSNLGNYTGALISLDKALAIDPKDEDVLYQKGVVLDNLGNHTGAILYYDKTLAIGPPPPSPPPSSTNGPAPSSAATSAPPSSAATSAPPSSAATSAHLQQAYFFGYANGLDDARTGKSDFDSSGACAKYNNTTNPDGMVQKCIDGYTVGFNKGG